MRAAIYARFSTDRQKETSLSDQWALLENRAASESWTVVLRLGDDGISGSTPVASRPAGRELLAAALAGRFDVLLLEGLDRLSRDQVESEQTIRRLELRGIRVVGVSDGYDSSSSARKLHRGMRGLINELYLDDLRAKTHRGLSGQLSRGYHAGGRSYGYRSTFDGNGYRLEVDPEAARIVREIFDRYGAGESCQRIAHDLNRRGVRSPRGGTWAVSAIYGSPVKGAGILNNEAYVGRVVWNRSQFVKDPDTGRRVRIERPRSEWVTLERPELRIVSAEQWAAVRERLFRPQVDGGSKGKGKPPRTLFSGLLRCGLCGGAVIAVSRLAYGCAARKDRGPTVCAGVRASRADTDAALLDHLRGELLSPAALEEFEAEVRAYLAELRREGSGRASAAKARVAEIEAEVGRLTDAIARIGFSPALADRLRAAETALRAAIEAAPVPTPSAIVPDALRRYRDALERLPEILGGNPEEARELLREVVGPMIVRTDAGETWVEIEAGAAILGRVAGAGFVTRNQAARVTVRRRG